ncbi:trypsin 3A1-like [Agrilus planipennis]|uniref:Trypsin 3A1-like n=1 Tax=Agrilus planipennis TaxID=224129 RepID=A0A1W4XLZ9_AGRPL|nr:trypsin 3A1-like [Agrilus planipennis]
MNPVVCIAFSFLGCFNFINAASIPSKAALTLPYGRSVEGAEVDISEYPYQVTLLYFSSQICAGSIISPRWILTAAHCLSSGNVLFRYTIRAGSNFRNSGGVSVAVVSIRPHSRYNSSSEEYDIGLVRITSDLTYDNTIRAVSLPTPNIDIRSGTNATATGWEDGVSQSHLRSVSIPLVDNDVCQQRVIRANH